MRYRNVRQSHLSLYTVRRRPTWRSWSGHGACRLFHRHWEPTTRGRPSAGSTFSITKRLPAVALLG